MKFPIQRYEGSVRRQMALRLAAKKAAGSLPQFVPNWVFRLLSPCHICLPFLIPFVKRDIVKITRE
ncbi:hypothetical protein BVU_3397 [Phocaeicola vulgatus ATCC 8482]|uniref:Uncharacterized protein n=1 Tax=Phocaeicola vulgatus (strain ATCC 8482 / DSM 1447 / JCM 5826 / CCUG 4940 / NBRC 14291 / NCTC 11154) TaxID=435590 RepID=A6L5Q9_PHOV8|nr:hypothetical protein BVU_3397 [Phocaeicola vulgatus ATCC 8482]PQL55875.1 hypothetical protein C5Z04_09430 [Phocaeicola vulgatus]QRN01440.1 hypothetical protein GFH35_23775 [Bacteroides xylanisolvens]